MRRPPPEWAISVRNKMCANGILNKDVARRLGKSEQWISNVMTGLYSSESVEKAIIEAVDEIIRERARHTA